VVSTEVSEVNCRLELEFFKELLLRGVMRGGENATRPLVIKTTIIRPRSQTVLGGDIQERLPPNGHFSGVLEQKEPEGTTNFAGQHRV